MSPHQRGSGSSPLSERLAAGFTPQPGLHKRREIRFGKLPPGQTAEALVLLQGLDNLQVEALPGRLALTVSYDITEYSFDGLEGALESQGFHLDSSLYSKLVRALVRYCEETQLRNLCSPQRLIKKSTEVYVQAWDHHPHGDHDDTPPELRDYR